MVPDSSSSGSTRGGLPQLPLPSQVVVEVYCTSALGPLSGRLHTRRLSSPQHHSYLLACGSTVAEQCHGRPDRELVSTALVLLSLATATLGVVLIVVGKLHLASVRKAP